MRFMCSALLLLASACASVPAPPLMPRPHAFVPAPVSGPSIRLVTTSTDSVRSPSRIGQEELAQARALLHRARGDLEPRQWETLNRKLAAAEQCFERFSKAVRASGQAAEVSRGAEGVARVGRAGTLAEAFSQVGPALVALILLYPSSTARAEIDRRPEWVDAQQEYEASLRDVSEASRQLMMEIELQPRAAKNPSRAPSAQSQPANVVTQEDDSRCKPIPLPRHLGGNDPHNECADRMPNNSFPGGDVYVNGKRFDALQLTTRTLWEVKTDAFDSHSRRSQQFFIEMKLPEIQRERRLAEECGYTFAVGVRSESHKTALKRADPTLGVFVMDWC